MLRSIALLVILLFAASTGSAVAKDVTRTFNTPTINGVRLDWCKFFGSQCGEPAAELFCQQNGYTRAVRFSIDPGLGAFGVPTVVFGDGRLCRAAICSGFRAITCAKPAPVEVKKKDKSNEPAGGQIVGRPGKSPGPKMITVVVNKNTTRFRYPQVNNVRLDWCRNWGSNCGEPAANLFCQDMGFARANRFVIDDTTGKKGIPSLVFGDGRVCNARYCNAFKLIACTRREAREDVAEPAQPRPDADQPDAETDVDVTVVPIPTRKPAPTPKAETAAKPVERPKPAAKSEGAVKPAIGFAKFEPLAPTVIAVNWINLLDTIDQYPEGASLYKCASGDCSLANSADFEVSPDGRNQTVQLNFRVGDVPHASGALWQASYLPFPPFAQGSKADLSPQGLLDYEMVNLKEGWFSVDLKALAKDLPGGNGQAIIHVRVLPVSEAGLEQVVGQPSNTMRIFYGTDLPPQPPYEFYAKEKVPDSRPLVRMTKLEFEPFHKIARWPPGCKTWEEKYDKDEKKFLEKVGRFLSGAWNWTSKSYQWMKNRVVDIAGTLTLNLIPDSAMEFALNSALVSAGIPPDIPNINAVMRDGVDGLARGVAKTAVQQVPTADLASNVGDLAVDITIETASGMAEEELRDRLEKEIEKRSRQALLQAADELEEELKANGKKALCSTTYFQGVYKVTIENTGDERYTDLAVRVDAAPVYLEKTWTVDLAPGETMTLVAVAAPKMPNGPYSQPLLLPGNRAEEDMSRWWNEIVYDKEVEIEVSLPGALECIGGDPTSQFCQRERFVAHSSPPQLVTEAYEFSQ
ncbi:MAG: hypothetical protein GY789_25775 [Hyphomicrobiales bacterium]|nr:hypothetical protein [Hyphomicrobiales bacterium]MCP4997894.1 hypothetical protein [Hyphomicrobiales bacterium]